MEIYDEELEVKALRTVCSRRGNVHCAKLFAQLDQSFFRHNHNRRIFRRIASRHRNRSKVPSWSALRTDPSLSEDARKHIRMFSDVAPLAADADRADYEDLFDNLNRFRQARLLWDTHEDGMRRLGEDNPDMDRAMDDLSDALARARFGKRLSEPMRIAGDGRDNSEGDFDGFMSDKPPEVVPTGFKQFDDRNRGILRGSLVIVAAPRGAGKSTFGVQLALNVATTVGSFDVCIVPLEMNRRRMNARIYANLAGLNKTKLNAWALSPEEKAKMRKARERFLAKLRTSGGSLVIDDPPMNVSVEDVLNMRAPYDDDMIVLDQLTLTRDAANTENKAATMNEAARFAKVWAEANDKVVVLLTQWDAVGGNTKYSHGPMEHADLSFTWRKDDDAADGGKAVMDIDMEKARDQDGFRFVLEADVQTGRVEDADDVPERKERGKAGTNGRRRRPKPAGDDMDMDEYLGDSTG